MRLLVLVLLALAAGCSSPPHQSIEIMTKPPGAAVYRLEGVPPGLHADRPQAVSAPAQIDPKAAAAIARTPTVYTARSAEPYRLHVELEGYLPYEVVVPAANIQGSLSLALEPGAALRDEATVLETILRRGPQSRAELDRTLAADLPAPRPKEALERLEKKELIDRIDTKPDVWDLAPRALVELRERLGPGEVEQALLESRRDLSRGSGKRK